MTDVLKPLPTAIDIALDRSSSARQSALETVHGTEWYFLFETIDPYCAPREELVELLYSAPNSATYYWMSGIIDTRTMFSAVTGIPF